MICHESPRLPENFFFNTQAGRNAGRPGVLTSGPMRINYSRRWSVVGGVAGLREYSHTQTRHDRRLVPCVGRICRRGNILYGRHACPVVSQEQGSRCRVGYVASAPRGTSALESQVWRRRVLWATFVSRFPRYLFRGRLGTGVAAGAHHVFAAARRAAPSSEY
jgi:hypothetical protein